VTLVQLRGRGSARSSRGPVLVDRAARRIRYLRVSVTDRCNYRCTYCMPPDGIEHRPQAEVLTFEEIERLVRVFVGWGVRRVRLTGGEPTVRRDIEWLVGRLARIRAPDGAPIAVCMTTNGERLPELARALVEAGLSGLTVSLDSLDGARFTRITRRGRLHRVLAGIEAARAAGVGSLKINTVAVRGFNDDELAELARFAWERDACPRFIETMPMAEGVLYVPGELMPAAEIRAAIARGLGTRLVEDAGDGVRGYGPASYWRVAAGPHAGRRMGTIGAMTENFCGECNRLRISATGRVHACLARDDAGDLRAALRSAAPDRLEEVVRGVLENKRDGHAFALDGTGGPRQAMIGIGG
jgi:cyclic pyranopterin phosphate synthase